MNSRVPIALLILAGAAPAHRLDEYLQSALVAVESNRVQVEVCLTPGVIVAPVVLAEIDPNGDGLLSESEQRAYATRFLGDLKLTVDGRELKLRLTSLKFPALAEMKEGVGEIQFTLEGDLPPGGGRHSLRMENRHHERLSAYQVNALVPRDPRVGIAAQHRNPTQSLYQLDYEVTAVDFEVTAAGSPVLTALGLLSPLGLLLLARLVFSRGVHTGT